MKRPPTDFELLKAIYERHREDFESSPRIQQKLGVLIPIDIPAIAESLGVNADTVFGRLYHHLDPKYAPAPSPDGSKKKEGVLHTRGRSRSQLRELPHARSRARGPLAGTSP